MLKISAIEQKNVDHATNLVGILYNLIKKIDEEYHKIFLDIEDNFSDDKSIVWTSVKNRYRPKLQQIIKNYLVNNNIDYTLTLTGVIAERILVSKPDFGVLVKFISGYIQHDSDYVKEKHASVEFSEESDLEYLVGLAGVLYPIVKEYNKSSGYGIESVIKYLKLIKDAIKKFFDLKGMYIKELSLHNMAARILTCKTDFDKILSSLESYVGLNYNNMFLQKTAQKKVEDTSREDISLVLAGILYPVLKKYDEEFYTNKSFDIIKKYEKEVFNIIDKFLKQQKIYRLYSEVLSMSKLITDLPFFDFEKVKDTIHSVLVFWNKPK
jgi:hypothetical protein